VTALEAVEAEAEASRDGDTFTLTTELGEAEIFVPPIGKWRSQARHALIALGDDFTWAQKTLAPEDFAEFVRCDPDAEESAVFFAAVMAANGENLPKSGPSPRSSKNTRKR
jgi:hypothetical protein